MSHQVHEWFAVVAKVDDSFVADYLEAESSLSPTAIAHAVKVGSPSIRHAPTSMELVSGQRAEAFVSIDDVFLGDGLATFPHFSGTGQWFAGQVVKQVEYVRA